MRIIPKILRSIRRGRSTERDNRGFSVVSVMVGAAVLGVYISLLSGGVVYFNSASEKFSDKNQALLLAQEGLEAVRNIKAAGFSDLDEGSFGVRVREGQWELKEAPDVIKDKYERRIVISNPEEGVKKITSRVNWEHRGEEQEIVLESRLTDWRKGSEEEEGSPGGPPREGPPEGGPPGRGR